MDLNISIDLHSDQNGLIKNVLERAFEFGYGCVALNTVVDSNKLCGKTISIPQPKFVDFKMNSSRKFRVLNRITAVIEDSIHAHHFLKSLITKKYDIIAVQPVGEKMLHHVCSTLDVDIISLNLTENLGYSLKRTSVGLATNKGACFEITYAPCLRDQTSKRMVISNAQLLVDVTKGRNLIISSGAANPLELRSVEDVMNLSLLFGLQKNQAEASVRKTGQLVLSHAGTRNKTGCGFVSFSGLFKLPKHQGWIVHACKVPNVTGASSSSQKRMAGEVSDTKEDDVTKKLKLDDESNK